MFVVFSSSLHPDSRSRILARAACASFEQNGETVEFIDLAQLQLPRCDGDTCYGDPQVQRMSQLIREANGVLIASPIYNYDVNAEAKNLVELTGQAWTEKVVGFLCAAGGTSSYMAPMGIANSLMLDFRSIIVPRFVYITGDAIEGGDAVNEDTQARVDELVSRLVTIANALQD